MSSSTQEMVRVNVYSPTGGQHAVYHSGLEVFGVEYVFAGGSGGGTGVSMQRPRVPPPGSGWTFYQSAEVAALRASKQEVERIVQEVRADFPAGSYDLVSRNCNHFSDALCKRLCGQGIPGWVNALAGIGNSLGVGNLIKSAMGQSAGSGGYAGGKADVGAGGLSSAGLMAGSVGADGDLGGEIDWASAGILNAEGDDAVDALRSGGVVASEQDVSAEMLFQLPFRSQVKLQAVQFATPNSEKAPSHVRLFANKRNLDMADAAGGEAPTADFAKIPWAAASDGSLAAKLEVNFLKFQNLGFLSMHLCREDDDGLPEEDGQPVCVQSVKFIGKV
mmetsp:Transcript_57856/g.102800  ORF Transcript_57856/g.102800 Transcript_57856/m.102800 type:complete len:333 (+) Transcript_57856:65-1063(+)